MFPGGALLVRVRGRTVHLSFHGRRSLEPPGAPVDAHTCFDLASLTKVLATTPLVLLSIQRVASGSTSRCTAASKGFSGRGRDAITVRMLLDHSSGLAAWRPYYETVRSTDGGVGLTTIQGRESVRRMVAAETPEAPPGSRALYSDLGFILLDWILERVTGQPADALLAEWLARPLSLGSLFFVDLKAPATAARVAGGASLRGHRALPVARAHADRRGAR